MTPWEISINSLATIKPPVPRLSIPDRKTGYPMHNMARIGYENRRNVIKVLTDGPLSQSQIVDRINATCERTISRDGVKAVIRKLIANGEIRKSGGRLVPLYEVAK